MSQADKDKAILTNLTSREAKIADAATRVVYERAGDWLTNKQSKADEFFGADLAHAKGRAAAYQNAAQELYGWAIAHGAD